MPWTREQQKVIDQRDADILVSAAAGSGKTAVLVERIIQKITDEQHPLDVDRLLVVTYTKAAAGEMKERIARTLDQKVQENPQNQHYVRQLSLINKAQITTIHSFCMDLIREYFYVLGIDPNITTGEEGQLSILREQIIDEILEEAYEKKEENFLQLIESYSPGKNDKVIGEYILNLYEKARSHVRPDQWLEQAKENVSVETLEEFRNAPFVQMILKDASMMVENAMQMIEHAISVASLEGGPYFYLKQLKEDREIFLNLCSARTMSEFCTQYIGFSKPRFTGRKKKTDQIDPILQEQCKTFRDHAYRIAEEIGGAYFYRKEGEILRELKIIKGPIRALIDLTQSFLIRYSERKIHENLMDFDDMEHFALKLLIDHFDEDGQPVPGKIALEKSQDYEEIYIDEYQDSNFIQDAILRSISKEAQGGHNMFMVGDVKQSIYSFRLARPQLFLSKYHRYQKEGEQYQLIELRNNFRSRKEVLTFTNDIFYEIMHVFLGNIEYTKEVALVPTMEFPGGCDAVTELLFLDVEEMKNANDKKAVLEARMIGRKIREMVEGAHPLMISDHDEEGQMILRKAEYKDIVILLRSMKENAQIIQEELMNQGIPAFLNSQKGYFDTVEIRTLLSLLSAVDNIYLDIDVAAVLRSPMIGMSMEDLGNLKVNGAKEHLYDCLIEQKDAMKKAAQALKLFHLLRQAKTCMSLNELIWLALDETGYYHFVGAMPQGKKRQGNLLMLIEQAKAFENHQIRGLFHFIRFMQQCREYDMDFGEATTFGENQNVVHISSIHKSKGLEYPIVFVSNIDKKFNLRDSNGSMIFHPDYFIGADIIDPVHRRKGKTILKSMIRRQMRKDALGEELRVLYVAMTRAKEKLILTGVKKGEIIWNQTRKPSYGDLLSATSYFDWISMALPRIPKQDFRIQAYHLEDLLWLQEKEEIDIQLEKQIFLSKLEKNVPKERVEKLKEAFYWKYPYEAETRGQLKYSVSEIKRMSQEKDPEEEMFRTKEVNKEKRVPAFMKEEKKISAASKGTAIHKVFELLDFSKVYSYQQLDGCIKNWISQGKIGQEYDKVIYRKDILAFLQCDLGKRIRKASIRGQVWKEKQFVVGIPFSEMEGTKDSDSYVVVQGIIDLFFEEDEKLVLVDYKTDWIKDGEQELLKKRYQSQIESYKKALEQMTGKKVKECDIYSIALNEAILL